MFPTRENDLRNSKLHGYRALLSHLNYPSVTGYVQQMPDDGRRDCFFATDCQLNSEAAGTLVAGHPSKHPNKAQSTDCMCFMFDSEESF
jgi:hypothetical protein